MDGEVGVEEGDCGLEYVINEILDAQSHFRMTAVSYVVLNVS